MSVSMANLTKIPLKVCPFVPSEIWLKYQQHHFMLPLFKSLCRNSVCTSFSYIPSFLWNPWVKPSIMPWRKTRLPVEIEERNGNPIIKKWKIQYGIFFWLSSKARYNLPCFQWYDDLSHLKSYPFVVQCKTSQ